MSYPQVQLSHSDSSVDLETRTAALEGLCPAAAAPTSQDIGFSFIGVPTNGATMGLYVATRALSIPAALAGTKAKAGTAPADNPLTLALKKNGSAAGTIAFAKTTGAVTLTAASAITLAAGDVLSLVNAATADSAAADFAITLQAARV